MNTPITHPTALADQYNAAARHARHALAGIAHAGRVGLITATGNPWLTQQATALAHALTNGTGRTCPHLAATTAPTVAHAAVWAPGHLVCPACTATLQPSTVEDSTCDRCRQPDQALHAGAVALGPVLLSYGLCRSCAHHTGLTPTPAPPRSVTNPDPAAPRRVRRRRRKRP